NGDQDADDQNDHHKLDEGESLLLVALLHEVLQHACSTSSLDAICTCLGSFRQPEPAALLTRGEFWTPDGGGQKAASRSPRASNKPATQRKRGGLSDRPAPAPGVLQLCLLDEVDDVEHRQVQRDD